MADCVFCKIINREIPGNFVYEDNYVTAIRDINPQAPVHILIMPKEHCLESAADVNENGGEIIGKIFAAAAKIAANEGLAKGWRLITNVGKDGGQTVSHIHFHLLGGKDLGPMLNEGG